MSSWNLDTLRRVVCDLAAYQNGEQVPLDVIESFLIALERVNRELLMKESINSELTSGEKEACELIRNSMAILLNLRDVQIRNNGNGSVPNNLDMESPVIGRPKFCIGLEQLSMFLEHRFSLPQIAEMLGVSISTTR